MPKSFTKNIVHLWQNAEKFLIVLFFATFTFNIRKVFLTPLSYINGQFNDFGTITIHLSDLLIILLIVVFTIKWLIGQYELNVEAKNLYKHNHGSLSIFKHLLASRETYILLLLLVWTALSIFWAPYRPLALYGLFMLLAPVTFAAIVVYLIRNGFIKSKFIIFPIIAGGTVQSIIAVSQYLLNRSIGIRFLGESILSPEIAGVAKIIISGQKHIRAYGTFPHPNILAGFLIIPIFLLVYNFLKSTSDSGSSLKNVSREIPHNKYVNLVAITIFVLLITAFILTFSRSAFIGLLIGSLVFFLIKYKSKRFNTRQIYLLVLSSILIVSSLFIVSRTLLNSLISDQSLNERMLYQNVSREIIRNHPMAGVGIGGFIKAENILKPHLEGWQYQPVHSIYLLIFSELGLMGFVLFLLFFTLLIFHRFRSNTNILLTIISFCIILCFLFISFFDHYFWDIGQGITIFIIPFIFIFSASNSGSIGHASRKQ